MLFISPALVVTPADPEQAHYPLIGIETKVTLANVSADSEVSGYPVTNLANPLTVSEWRSASTAEQLITIEDLEGQTDYVGIARHNLGSAGVAVTVEGITGEIDAEWEVLLDSVTLGDDSPHVFRFAKDYYVGIQLRLVPADVAPKIAVMFAGALQTIWKGIAPGYTPLHLGEQIDILNGRSASGEHLGAIVTGATLASTASFQDIDPEWFAANMPALLSRLNRGASFFWLWSPTTHPDHVAYANLARTAVPVISRATEHYDLDLSMSGLAL